MPQIAPPTQPTVSVQVPVPTPVEPAPQPAAARPNQDFLDGYAAALQQQGKGKGKDEEPPADQDAKPAAVSLPPPQPDTDRRQQVVPHTLIFPYLPPPRKRFRPRAKYARVSEFTRHPEYHALLSQITPWDKQNDAGDVGHGVLADWLEERGFPAVARHIRESAALAPEMPGDISPRYGLPGRTQVQPGQPVMDTLHSPSTGKARIVLRLPDKYTPAGDATRMIGVDRRWVSHYMTPAEAAKRVREMGREGVALFRHSTGPGAFGPGGVRHINTDAKAAKRMARPRKYAAQRAWATWQSLHPEIRHTPLGAALVHVANGHGGDQTATHLAYAAVHAAGEHDSPMKLEPIGVLADYLEDSNPGHPLARAFNWNGIVNKLELDRLVEAHAAQTAAGKGYTPIGGHDWTQYELNNIAAGSSPESSLHGNLHHAVAAAHAAGISATPEDISRAAKRASSRRFGSRDAAHRIWDPDDYHDQVGRQVMADTSPTAITPPDDPRRFARAVAASLGAKT